jgi:nucleoside permease NupC
MPNYSMFGLIATGIAIPLWFVGFIVVMDAIKPIDNPAGIPVYAIMCAVATVFVAPVNAFGIAPSLARMSMDSTIFAIVIHSLLGVAVSVLFAYWPTLIDRNPSAAGTIILYYLSIFLIPPVLIASTAYSIRYNLGQRQRRANI